ncbi:hypothetical protein NB701_004234 [Pantoea ananatis]|nr:hypothetical protein [Pantoea ananatis]
MRALPPGTNNKDYTVYEVLKPIPNVQERKIAPWFGEIGLGTQYKLDQSVQKYVDSGHLKEIKKSKENLVDKEELIKNLNKLSIPNDSYSIGSIEDETLCMIFDDLMWCIFYSERGHRTEPEYFASENDACHAFIKRIKKWF